MTYLNRFHQESTDRMLRKMEEWKKSPTFSLEAAEKMKQNLTKALHIEATFIQNKSKL